VNRRAGRESARPVFSFFRRKIDRNQTGGYFFT
jgi:hypothetical protein